MSPSEWIALASVGVAALAVVFAPLTAAISVKLANAAEQGRWAREQRERLEDQGRKAAADLLPLLDDLRAVSQAVKMREPTPDAVEDLFRAIQRLAILIPDPAVRGTVDKASWCMRSVKDLAHEVNIAPGRTAFVSHQAAHEVLGAYLRREPLPSDRKLSRLYGALEEYWANIEDQIGDDEHDFLDDPEGDEGRPQ